MCTGVDRPRLRPGERRGPSAFGMFLFSFCWCFAFLSLRDGLRAYSPARLLLLTVGLLGLDQPFRFPQSVERLRNPSKQGRVAEGQWCRYFERLFGLLLDLVLDVSRSGQSGQGRNGAV